MTDVAVAYDVDQTADMYLDFDERVVGSNTVRVPKAIMVDGVTNNKAEVLADRSQTVTIKAPVNGVDAHSRGATGSALVPAAVSTSSVTLLSAATSRRCVWFANSGANTVWITPGGAAAIIGRGVPLYPGAVVAFDGSPNAAFTAVAEGGTNNVAIAAESD